MFNYSCKVLRMWKNGSCSLNKQLKSTITDDINTGQLVKSSPGKAAKTTTTKILLLLCFVFCCYNTNMLL